VRTLAVALALARVVALAAGGAGDDGATTGDADRCVHLAVPAYVSPAQLVRAAAGGETDVIVLNPGNGPDVERDEDLATAVETVRDEGVVVLGYVATGYGRGDVADVLEQARTYARWYGVDGIFLDEVSSEAEHVDRYAEITAALRAGGFDPIALNPGVYPDAGYLPLADFVVTFEGTAREYRGDIGRPADLDAGTTTEWHLVHTATEADAEAAIDRAAERGVSRVFVTNRPEDADTWNALPPYFDAEVRWARRAQCPPSP
jgi:hypothetical protein